MNSELARRIAFTLGALLVYRLGTHIPLPGLAPSLRARFSICSLGIFPYISAAILIQLVSLVWPRLDGLAKSGVPGRRTIARYTLGLTVILAAIQAIGIARGLQGVRDVVSDPGGLFLVSTTVSLLGGTFFLVWLSEQITARGIGNGLALILATGIVVGLPSVFANILELGRRGVLSQQHIGLIVMFSVATVGLIVFMELARRNLPVQFVARNLRDRSLPARSSFLSLKLNHAGMIPAVVASWALLPMAFAGLVLGDSSPWLNAALKQLEPGHLGHIIITALVVIALAFIYTAYVIDPERAADSLVKHGGVIPGVMPGEPTAEYLDRVVSRTTFAGAIYLALVFLLPEALLAYANVPYYFGGAAALIVVCAVLDIKTQVGGEQLTEPGGVYS
jgi:preprotein translocase subunit SecY